LVHDDPDFPRLLAIVSRETGVAALPRGDEPALLLAEADRRVEVVRAFERIAPMFWGDRIPLDEACATIVQWIWENFG
jgi:hypothetical protein